MNDLVVNSDAPVTDEDIAQLRAMGAEVLVQIVSFTVYGQPQPRGSKVVGRTKNGRSYVRDSAKGSYPWMKDVAQAAGIAMIGKPLLTGPVRVDLDFYRARPKAHYGSGKNAEVLKASAPKRPIVAPDAGKLARGVQDAMKGSVYRDDAQIVEETHRKFYGTPERCEIRVYAL